MSKKIGEVQREVKRVIDGEELPSEDIKRVERNVIRKEDRTMPEGYEITPIKIARSRTIQVRQFEPEQVYIEYEIRVTDQSRSKEAIIEATKQASAYLDMEEKRLRNGTTAPTKNEQPVSKNYSLEITPGGKKLGKFRIDNITTGQFVNFIHLWFKNSSEEFYVGHLRKDKGQFFFKVDNKEKTDKYGIKIDQHFKVITQ